MSTHNHPNQPLPGERRDQHGVPRGLDALSLRIFLKRRPTAHAPDTAGFRSNQGGPP